MPSGKSVLIGAVVVFFILFALDLVVREYRPRKPMSKVAVVFALLVVPLIAIPLTLIGDKVVSELGVSLRVRDVILLSALALPALLSVFIARWGGPTTWFMAIALGIASGPHRGGSYDLRPPRSDLQRGFGLLELT
jgi:hypothetical protein